MTPRDLIRAAFDAVALAAFIAAVLIWANAMGPH